VTQRRDKRGRRIGRNWWREMNCEQWWRATLDWEEQREREALGYETEMREFEQAHPRPNLKSFLLANAGMATEDPDLAA